MTEPKKRQESVNDSIAMALERAGLWRRASARWSLLLGEREHTDAQREWLLRRQKFCLEQIPLLPREKLELSKVVAAADATLLRMGIACPGGEAFRQK